MKRDLLLCADIIRLIAESEEIVTPQTLWGDPSLGVYGDEQISYHAHLLRESGFVLQCRTRMNEDGTELEYCEYLLTNAGQDFYAIATHPAFREYHYKVAPVLGGSPPYEWVKAHVEAVMLKEILAVVARDDAEVSEDSFYALRGIAAQEENPVYHSIELTPKQAAMGEGIVRALVGGATKEVETQRATIKRFAYALWRRDAITLSMFGLRVSDFSDYREQPDFYDAVISALVRGER